MPNLGHQVAAALRHECNKTLQQRTSAQLQAALASCQSALHNQSTPTQASINTCSST
jgi:hypothetical protein